MGRAYITRKGGGGLAIQGKEVDRTVVGQNILKGDFVLADANNVSKYNYTLELSGINYNYSGNAFAQAFNQYTKPSSPEGRARNFKINNTDWVHIWTNGAVAQFVYLTYPQEQQNGVSVVAATSVTGEDLNYIDYDYLGVNPQGNPMWMVANRSADELSVIVRTVIWTGSAFAVGAPQTNTPFDSGNSNLEISIAKLNNTRGVISYFSTAQSTSEIGSIIIAEHTGGGNITFINPDTQLVAGGAGALQGRLIHWKDNVVLFSRPDQTVGGHLGVFAYRNSGGVGDIGFNTFTTANYSVEGIEVFAVDRVHWVTTGWQNYLLTFSGNEFDYSSVTITLGNLVYSSSDTLSTLNAYYYSSLAQRVVRHQGQSLFSYNLSDGSSPDNENLTPSFEGTNPIQIHGQLILTHTQATSNYLYVQALTADTIDQLGDYNGVAANNGSNGDTIGVFVPNEF